MDRFQLAKVSSKPSRLCRIGDALRYLRVTQEGQQWIVNLYAHVFSIEHRGQLSHALL